MSSSHRAAALRRVDDFENGIDQETARVIGASERYAHHAEGLVRSVFAACGFHVGTLQSPPVRHARQIDFDFFVERGSVWENVIVEVKTSAKPVSRAEVDAIAGRIASRRFDRLLIVARNGFTAGARDAAETNGLGWLDLLDPPALRSWLARAVAADGPPDERESLIRGALRGIASEIGRRPALLAELPWFDLDRIAQPADAKHWTAPSRTGHDRHFVKVSARATSGLTFAGIQEYETRPVLRDGVPSLLGLCRTFYRIGSELWTPDRPGQDVLFERAP
jgi:hypothetical protein